jgi:hypothetical protein
MIMKKIYLFFFLFITALSVVGQEVVKTQLPYAAYKEGMEVSSLKSGNVSLNSLTTAFSSASAGQINALLLVADEPGWVASVQTSMMATGMFNVLDVINYWSSGGQVTLEQLRNYDAVLVWADAKMPDANGETLAAYIDEGGGVVSAVFNLYTGWGIEGTRFNTDYLLMELGDFSASASMGTVHDPGHPIMDGISVINSFHGHKSGSTTVTPGSIVVASYTDGVPLVVIKENLGPANARRADINYFPPDLTYTNPTDDAALLLSNALFWVSKAGYCPGDIVVDNDSGECSAVVDYTVTAPEKGSFVQTAGLPTGTEFPVGTTINTFLLTDSLGVESTCSFTVTVNDTEPPVIDCPENIVVSNDPGECGAIVEFGFFGGELVVDDVPAGSLSEWEVTDTGGNPAFSYTEIESPYDGSTAIKTSVVGVTVSQCPSQYIEKTYNISGNTDETKLKAYLEFTSTMDTYNFPYVVVYLFDNEDNQVGFQIYYGKGVISGIYANYASSDPDNYTELSDSSGDMILDLSKMGSDIDFTKIKIVLANYACVGQNSIIFDHLRVINGSLENGNGTLGNIASDNCSDVHVEASIPSGSFFPVGTTPVTLTATDAAGNMKSCTFNVTVNDTEPPVAVCGSSGAGKNVLLLWDTDNANTQSLKAAIEAADFTVTLPAVPEYQWDGTNPSLDGFDAVIHLNGTTYEYGLPLSAQNALLDFVQVQGKLFVHSEWDAYELDAAGYHPALAPIVILQRSSGYETAITYNTVPGYESHPVLEGLASSFSIDFAGHNVGQVRHYDTYPAETLMLDQSGNAAVAIRELEIGRVVGFGHAGNYASSNSLSNANVQQLFINALKWGTNFTGEYEFFLDENGTVTITPEDIDQGSTDNCGIASMELSQTVFTRSDIGTQTVTLTVTDLAGNTATTSAKIIITSLKNPNFDDVENMQVECDGEGNLDDWEIFISKFVIADFPEAQISFDNDTTYKCGLTISVQVNASTWLNSEIPSTMSATFTIIDTTPPAVTTPADITIEAGENCEWDANTEITGMATASDDCSGETGVALTYADVEEDMGKGVIIITRTWTATDACGNTATDQQVITVTGGNAPPELVLNEIDIYLTIEGQWTLNRFDIEALTAGSAAGCGADDDLNFVVNPRYFHCADVFAPVEITVTASDSRGNSASGKVYVNVYDTIAPIAYCKDTTIYLDSFGQTLIVPGAVNMGGNRESLPEWARYHNNLEGGSIDACGIQYMDLSKQIFTCNDIGENIVTLTVYDPSGNFATCQAVVTVIDPIAPVFEPVADLEFTAEPGVCVTHIPYPQILATDNCPVVPELVEGFGPGGLFPIGTTIETWKAVDASGNEAWLTFNVTVKTYNAPPTIAAIEDIVVDEDPILIEIPLTNITPNVDCDHQQIISLLVSTDNAELITALNLEYVMGETTGTLLVTVGPNMNGEAWVTLTVKDNGGTENGGSDTTVETFKITVVPVPDMPEVTAPLGIVTTETGESIEINLNDIFTNPDDDQGFDFNVSQTDGSPLPDWMEFDPGTGIISGTPGDEDAGVYEVTVVATNSNGDSVETTFTVVIVKPGTSVIAGTVIAVNGPVTGGISVMLFKVDINNMHLAVGNVAVAANGTFAFYNLENGIYMVKALVTNAEMHPTLFHTWYETAISVLDASAITITQPGIENIQLTMVDGLVADGNYTIEGRILTKTEDDEDGVPAAYVDLVLKQDGIIVAVTMTDQNGNYSFEGLPEGTYDVFVEVPGYQQKIDVQVTLDAANPNQKNVNFTIWLNMESMITEVKIVDKVIELKMYPNPSQGMVNIDMTWNDIRNLEVTVFNIWGAKVFSKEYLAGNLIQFDLSKQVTGIYLVRIEAEGQSIIKKLVIKRK